MLCIVEHVKSFITSDRGRGSNEHPQFMFQPQIRNEMHTPENPNFNIYKWDSMESLIHGHVNMMLPFTKV